MTQYTIPHVDVQSWIDAGDPVENVDLDASQSAADDLLMDRLTSLYPEHEFAFGRNASLANVEDDDALGASAIDAAYQWVYDHADDWLAYTA